MTRCRRAQAARTLDTTCEILGTYSLLEDRGLGVLNRLSDLLLGGIWAHNAVLTLSGSL